MAKGICPICESNDIHVNEKNELFCFTCFNLFSSDDLNKDLNKPPKFPDHLERRKLKKKHFRDNYKVNSKGFLRRIV